MNPLPLPCNVDCESPLCKNKKCVHHCTLHYWLTNTWVLWKAILPSKEKLKSVKTKVLEFSTRVEPSKFLIFCLLCLDFYRKTLNFQAVNFYDIWANKVFHTLNECMFINIFKYAKLGRVFSKVSTENCYIPTNITFSDSKVF